MLSAAEKEKITEKVKFENEIRKTLNEESPKKNIFLNAINSKIGILLIGAFLTGVLIPIFQNNQKTLEEKRQNNYENWKERLNHMKNYLEEFIVFTTYPNEAYEMANLYMKTSIPNDTEYIKLKTAFKELLTKQYLQSAKLRLLIIYFPDKKANEIVEIINKYKRISIEYIRYLNDVIDNLKFSRKIVNFDTYVSNYTVEADSLTQNLINLLKAIIKEADNEKL